MTGWQIVEVCSNFKDILLERLLDKGWEPFCVTGTTLNESIWLRRRTPEGQESGIRQEAVYE